MSTAGVTVGDPVLRTGKPLSVELGPGELYTDNFVKKRNLHQASGPDTFKDLFPDSIALSQGCR